MIYKTREQFYTSKQWRKTAKAYASSKGLLCERCLKKGLIVPYEEVHHKIRLTLYNLNKPEITLNFNNLEALCKKCHEEEHREDAKARPYKRADNKAKQPVKRYIVNQQTGAVEVLEDPEDE